MGLDPSLQKELTKLQKQWEGLRDRHNTLEQEVHRLDGNADRAIAGVNKMCTQATFDGSWALLNKRLEAIETAQKNFDATQRSLQGTVQALAATVEALAETLAASQSKKR